MIKCLSSALVLALITVRAAAWPVDPPSTADPTAIKDCTNWAVAAAAQTCEDLAKAGYISLADLKSYNPSLGDPCKPVVGNSYCVESNYGIPPVTTTTGPTTTPGNGITTPTPTQEGMVGNCNKFHLVKPGQSCSSILSEYSISLADFFAWNPSVKSDCSGMWANVNVCVGLIGGATPTSTSGNGISTPTPTQEGMVANCNKFYLVKPNERCDDIASKNGISVKQFTTWNPAATDDCSGQWANVYACVGVVGSTPTPTTSTPSNGITTPTPTQSGMVSNCNKFYLVKPNERCDDIASKNGISVKQFTTWNPAAGSDCTGQWANVWACVGIVGFTPTSSKPTPTSTAPSNGVPTPTPIQDGMTSKCKTFHKVVKGDSCYDIAAAAKIDLSYFYKMNPSVGTDCGGLWLGYFVCIKEL